MDLKRDLTAHLVRGGMEADQAAHVVQTAHCLLRRSCDWLVTAHDELGAAKASAFCELLRRPKFWVAAFACCADLAVSVHCPGTPPLRLLEGSEWLGVSYETWHMSR